MNTVLFVRHGNYTGYGQAQQLTERGVAESEAAARSIAGFSSENNRIIMASTQPRALQTAEVIMHNLFADYVYPSRYLDVGGNEPRGIESLDTFIEEAVRAKGLDPAMIGDLVLVTHAPLCALVAGFSSRYADSYGHGRVTEYEPHTWNNPEYSDVEAELLQYNLTTDS